MVFATYRTNLTFNKDFICNFCISVFDTTLEQNLVSLEKFLILKVIQLSMSLKEKIQTNGSSADLCWTIVVIGVYPEVELLTITLCI